tara:strand:+ start:167 stop:346 length:180 start_codon:yes stop_codon:yes gene_type:complete
LLFYGDIGFQVKIKIREGNMITKFLQQKEWITGSKILDIAIFLQLATNIALTLIIVYGG